MKRAMTAMLLGLFMLAGAAAPAGAETRLRNRSSVALWTAHAYASTYSTWGFCGWPDGCNGSGLAEWRVHGWWRIAPGGTVVVHSAGYGNAWHDAWGEDDFGNVWSGDNPANASGNTYSVGNDKFDHCGEAFGVDPSATPHHFFRARGTRCCGGTCPDDGTINFN
jgi:hypothetical protein